MEKGLCSNESAFKIENQKFCEKRFVNSNNASFGYDCRNDIDNCKFEPIHDEIDYISYIRKITSLFGKSVSEFLNSRVIAEEIDVKFNKGMMRIDPNDRFREAKINALEVKAEDFNAVELIKM